MGTNPSYNWNVYLQYLHYDSLLYPVERITWFDAVLYCNARSKRDGLDTVYSYTAVSGIPGDGCDDLVGLFMDTSKYGYRLPTEAEWEYACRAGSTTDYYWGQNYPPVTSADSARIDSYAVYGDFVFPVATRMANSWGLYDMSGNVFELCYDWYGTYSDSEVYDPTGPIYGLYREFRGGSGGFRGAFDTDYLRSSYRYGNLYPSSRSATTGFRTVMRK